MNICTARHTAIAYSASAVSPRGAMSHSRAVIRGRRARLCSTLTGRGTRLLSLAQVEATCTVVSRHSGGTRTVPLRRIRGSATRCNDFDRNFNPLQDHTIARWQSVARARRRGIDLPPVELIQVGAVYFVIDGHHRISVAKVLGQLDIEAEVTVWDVAGQLPWESSGRAKVRRSRAAAARPLPQSA